jgi:hypothetical protein
VRLLVLRARVEGTQGRGRRHALARPGLAPCALWRGMDAFWAPLGALVLASPRHGFVESRAGQRQVSEGKRNGMVVQACGDQRRCWHEGGMPCHGMASFGQICAAVANAIGRNDVVK